MAGGCDANGNFIAGLQQIPEEQYESAKIDGATAFQRFRYVTFPYLLPTVTVNLILTIKQDLPHLIFRTHLPEVDLSGQQK